MELSRKLVHSPDHSERQSGQREGQVLGEGTWSTCSISLLPHALPATVSCAES